MTGIYPFNDKLFSDAEFIEEANKKQPISFYESVKQKRLGPTAPQNITGETGADLVQPREIVDYDDPQPSTSSGVGGIPQYPDMLEDLEKSTVSKTTSPFDITPIPQVKRKKSNRGRKACSSTVITSTPYKDQLIQAKQIMEAEQQVKSRGRGCKINRGRGRGSVMQPSRKKKNL